MALASDHYVPLRSVVPAELWPASLGSLENALDRMAYVNSEIIGNSESWGAWYWLAAVEETLIPLPFLEGTGLVIGSGDLIAIIMGRAFDWRARLSSRGAAGSPGIFRFRFGRELLLPAVQTGSPPRYVPDENVTNHVESDLPFAIDVDSDGNFDLSVSDGASGFSLPACFIGRTGVMLQIQNATVRMNADTEAPAGFVATPALSDSWRGLLITKAVLQFPPDLGGLTVELGNAQFGSGGFSGAVRISTPQDINLFGFDCELTDLDISFVRNAVTKFSLAATVRKVPLFEKPLNVVIGLSTNGDFTMALASSTPVVLDGDFLSAAVSAVAVTRRDSKLFLTLSGKITPKVPSGIQWPTIALESLMIGSDGSVDLGGSWIDLPSRYALDFHGFGIEFSRIGFGSGGGGTSGGSAGERWIGIDGSIRLADGIGLGGSVQGMQIFWDPGNPSKLPRIKLSGISIDLTIPNALELHGQVSFNDTADTKQFTGSGQIKLPALNCFIDCQLKILKVGGDTALYVYVDADLPAGVPIASTGLGLFNIGGLFGSGVKPDRKNGESWFAFFKRDPVGIPPAPKWVYAPGHRAFGAKTTIGTMADDGFAFNSQLILALLLPGPTVLLEGRARLAAPRNAPGDPPYRALAVYDGKASTLTANVEARWKYPPAGPSDLIKVRGTAEGFFDFNRAERWHVFLGERSPDSKRIQAKILKVFKADAYVMLTQPEVAIGASVGVKKKYKFGPMAAGVKAYFESAAELQYRPMQLDAEADLHGRISLKAFGFGMGVSLNAEAEVKTPAPKDFSAEVHVEMDLPRPLPDPEATVRLRKKRSKSTRFPYPVADIDVASRKASESWKTGNDESTAPVIPLDGKPVISFTRPMLDAAGVAGNIQSAPTAHVRGSSVSYTLTGIHIERRTAAGTWQSVCKRPETAGIPAVYGMWVPVAGTDESPPATKLMLFITTPFDSTPNALTPAAADQFAELYPHYPAVPICVDFEQVPVGSVAKPQGLVTTSADGSPCVCHWVTGGTDDPVVREASANEGFTPFGYRWKERRSLHLGKGTTWISLSAPSKWVQLRITSPNAFSVIPVSGSVRTEGMDENGRKTVTYAGGTPGTPQSYSASHGPRDVEVILKGSAITMIGITGILDLFQICHITKLADGEIATPGTTEYNEGETAKVAQEEFLFAPDTTYRITVATRVSLSPALDKAKISGVSGFSGSTADISTIKYFQTKGPPGFVGTALDRKETGGGATSALRRLVKYVGFTTPAEGTSQVFRGYDVTLRMNEQYVERLYATRNYKLAVFLVDRNGRAVSLNTSGANLPSSTPSALPTNAVKAPQVEPRSSEMMWNNMVRTATYPIEYPLQNKIRNDWLVLARAAVGSAAQPSYPVLTGRTQYVATLTAVDAAGKPLEDMDEGGDLYSFAFSTSAFSCFSHLVRSFTGRLWSPTSIPVLPTAQQILLRKLASGSSTASFSNIASILQIDTTKPAPEQLEITLLQSANRRWGFLIDFPEPVPELRASASLLIAPAPASEVQLGNVRLAELGFGDHSAAEYNTEWLELTVTEAMDLKDLVLERVVPGAPESYVALHQFPATGLLDPGTTVRLFAGIAPATTTPDGRALQLYRTAPGGTPAWLFGDSSDTVRLRGPSGEFSRRTGLRTSAYTAASAQWKWNTDRNRALVFPTSSLNSTDLSAGTYRFEWTYVLEPGADPMASTRLSYRGSAAPERAAVQVVVPPPPS
jgi:hypothetical protein